MENSDEKSSKKPCKNPYDPNCMSSLKHWGEPPPESETSGVKKEAIVDCGWGRLIFGQTFSDPQKLAVEICKEKKGRRDIAMYMRDPHVVLSYVPQELFLDPSITYRLDFQNYSGNCLKIHGLKIRPVNSRDDEAAINAIYQAWGMVPSYKGFYSSVLQSGSVHVLVAEELSSGSIVGAVTGVDHFRAFNDADNGSSLWALAVDKQCRIPRVGETLVRELILYFIEQGRRFIDLSVMYTNKEAKALYDKLGFEQVPVYCIKTKNYINEPLFTAPEPDEKVNVYAGILIDEARRRGIGTEIVDAENGFFRLSFGGRSIACRESLSELTSAVAMSRCDDKAVTRKILQAAGLKTPAQKVVTGASDIKSFLATYDSVVVKPARGEQGEGVCVDLKTLDEVKNAINRASELCEKVIMEEYVQGEDLRIIVIDDEVVAAAVRKPASICGTGIHTVAELIEKQSRRRAKATQGESKIPLDEETQRCVENAGYSLDHTLPKDKVIQVRKTANLHTGGTINDVTSRLHPKLIAAAIAGAGVLSIPVVGFDFLVPTVEGDEYVIIEANERPGLANHEPQPTAEKFIDLLFPKTKHHV
ncbi:GNAT-family acetyltransferase TIGR03103 [Desulforhopalus singaporensis]|uniref:GNAT-family acetyltransferase TIGR03103 n=2 Tax=Desulforhopalus singaporensis TaxID=91360 RepID=A0A1H0VRK4_9BACT|nr:GNAT-family acetyltransferase TIGR03103 [Desulforhopalus singaporensis]